MRSRNAKIRLVARRLLGPKKRRHCKKRGPVDRFRRRRLNDDDLSLSSVPRPANASGEPVTTFHCHAAELSMKPACHFFSRIFSENKGFGQCYLNVSKYQKKGAGILCALTIFQNNLIDNLKT
jgi:hypothetical protein